MVNYETFCQILDHLGRQRLTVAQTARALALDPRTVAKWANVEQFRPRAGVPRASKLDALRARSHAGLIPTLTAHSKSSSDCARPATTAASPSSKITSTASGRATRRPSLNSTSPPGECAQVDWGEYGTIAVGSTRRRLSFFLMVLCYSRRMYLEFTVSQKMEFFLACHENAFAAFGGCPTKIMVDNLKSAVLQRMVGQAPVFNPKYLDFSRHWGFEIIPCNVRVGNEKGRVENGVGFVKKNLLAGLELPDFSAMQPAATVWVDTVANVRVHGATHQRPIDRFADERAHLLPLNPAGFDLARVGTVRATKQFRVPLDSNHYSVPSRYAGLQLTLKAYADRVCIYDGGSSSRAIRAAWIGTRTSKTPSTRGSCWPSATPRASSVCW